MSEALYFSPVYLLKFLETCANVDSTSLFLLFLASSFLFNMAFYNFLFWLLSYEKLWALAYDLEVDYCRRISLRPGEMLFERADIRVASKFIWSFKALFGELLNKIDDVASYYLMAFLLALFSIFG